MKKAQPSFMTKKTEKKPAGKPAKYAKGGGIESKGHTKGKMVKMAGGGMCK